MPAKRRPKSAGNKSKNDLAKSKTSEDSVVKDQDLKPIQESQESQEPKASPQQKEVEAEREPDKVEDKGEAQCWEKSNDSETDGQSKKGKKRKNKKQDDKANEADSLVNLVNAIEKPASKQEKLWKNIEDSCKGCPDPIFDFLKKLANGKHWTFFNDFNKEDLKNVLDSCKCTGAHGEPSLQGSDQTQKSERRGKSRGKASEETSETKHEIEIKRKSGEISELGQRLEAGYKDMERLQSENKQFQQNNEKIYAELKCRDEQLLHLNNKNKNLDEEVMSLRMQLRREEEKCKRLVDLNKQVAEDRDQFKDRFSKLAETKLTAGNAHIQDLSDMNRPQKLGEKLSELYDNEWTDAFEDLRDTENLDEKSNVLKLLEIFKTCVSFCQLNAEMQEMSLMESVRKSLDFSWTEKSELCNGSLEESNEDILSPRDTKILKDLLKTKAGISVTHVKKVFLAENPNYAALGESVQAFINGCLEVCWLSAIQDPPLAFDWNFPEGSDVADKVVKLYTKSGTKVDYVVWPVMKLHVDGDILSKGVVQPIPEEKIKKKKNS